MQDSEIKKETTDAVDDKSYDRNIDVVANGILNFLYIGVTIIFFPIIFFLKNGNKFAALAFFFLLFFVITVRKYVEKHFNKCKRQELANFFEEFERIFYTIGYTITSMGYIMILMNKVDFMWAYFPIVIIAIIIIILSLITFCKERSCKKISCPEDYSKTENEDFSKEKNPKENNLNKKIYYKIKLKEMIHRKKYIRKVKIEYSYEKKLQKHNSYNKDKED